MGRVSLIDGCMTACSGEMSGWVSVCASRYSMNIRAWCFIPTFSRLRTRFVSTVK